MSGIMISISTMSISGVLLQHLDRVCPFSAGSTCILCGSRIAGHREDIPDIVVDDEHLLDGDQLVAIDAATQSLCCERSAMFSDFAVQEQAVSSSSCSRVLTSFEHDRLRQSLQSRLFLRVTACARIDTIGTYVRSAASASRRSS